MSSCRKEKPGSPSASKDPADIAEELFPDAPSEQEQMPAEDDGANPPEEDLEPGLTDEDEEEGPTRPPLPEDMGHRAGFQAVSEGRLEDAMVLASLPLWPFTNELNSRGWTLLHVAAHGGFEELCAALCRRKDFLCVDMPDKEFWATPLHLAAGKRRRKLGRSDLHSTSLVALTPKIAKQIFSSWGVEAVLACQCLVFVRCALWYNAHSVEHEPRHLAQLTKQKKEDEREKGSLSSFRSSYLHVVLSRSVGCSFVRGGRERRERDGFLVLLPCIPITIPTPI
ncbi:unnamed protein product [Symbiodinium necroappetens]|uniref:Uncharacterized protein n=1 Tax=Symbiodinium necroappetens TaxID=1628268 RepID=A0A812VQ23_9DINO|nr:unnamed protein product [Symbiodinium necroappetens]